MKRITHYPDGKSSVEEVPDHPEKTLPDWGGRSMEMPPNGSFRLVFWEGVECHGEDYYRVNPANPSLGTLISSHCHRQYHNAPYRYRNVNITKT